MRTPDLRSLSSALVFLVIPVLLLTSPVEPQEARTPLPYAHAQEVLRSGVFDEGPVADRGTGAQRHRLPLAVNTPHSLDTARRLVSRELSLPEHSYGVGHRVVDLFAAPGDEVLASAGGVVSFVGTVAGTPVLTIAHGGALHTTYEPIVPEVRKGERVSRGQRIGRLADASALPATARKPQGLSWGAWVKEPESKKTYLDPFTLLGATMVRLLS